MAADAVHKTLEDAVPAMEYYMARGVFTKDEVKDIVKRRTHMEYVLNGPNGGYEEVTEAVAYELGLENIRRKRIKGKAQVKNRFDEHILQRIGFLYEKFSGIFRGEDRIRLGYAHLDFLSRCRPKDYDKKAGQALGKLVSEFPTREDVLVFAAKWELEQHESIDNARAILQRALRLVPKGCKLWRAYFMIELTYLGELLQKLIDDPLPDGTPVDEKLALILSGKIPTIVHTHAMAAFTDSEQSERLSLTSAFLKIARTFPFTKPIQQMLCKYLSQHNSPEAHSCDFVLAASSSMTPGQFCNTAGIDDGELDESKAKPDPSTLNLAASSELERVLDGLVAGGEVEGVLATCDAAVVLAYGCEGMAALVEGADDAMRAATHPFFAAARSAVEAIAQNIIDGNAEPTPAQAATIATILASSTKSILPPFLSHCLSLPACSASLPLHRKSFALAKTPKDAAAALKRGIDAAVVKGRAVAGSHDLWCEAVLLAYGTDRLASTIERALTVTAAMETGAPRDLALTKVGGACILAAPKVALKCLSTTHKLPEALASQMVSAAIGPGHLVPETEPALKKRRGAATISTSPASDAIAVRQLFDRLLRASSGLGKSPRLWALWINYEHRIDPKRAVHVRAQATRAPGGVTIAALDAELAKLQRSC